jgi:hypothetical protein
MSKPRLLLRFFQINFIVAVLLSAFVVRRFPYQKTVGAITLGQWFVVLFAIYSAIGGFLGQRIVNRVRNQPTRSSLFSSPLGRWGLGHLVRLSGAEAVCFSALALRIIGGPTWLVDGIFGFGLLLLLTWWPGISPAQTVPGAP